MEDSSETLTDFERKRRELSMTSEMVRSVDSPAGALSIDDLARSREEAALPPGAAATSLPPAPIGKVTGKGRHGPLPVTARDGTKPWQVYSRPLSPHKLLSSAPKVALMIGGMGLNADLTRAAIMRLPADVSLAFAPYGEKLQETANFARARGHEIFVQLPMEPFGYPSVNPGPRTLLTSASATQNIDSLYWHMSRFAGYAGVTNYLGAQFASNTAAITPILTELGKRGLVYIDDGGKGTSKATSLASSLGLPARSATVSLDGDGSPVSIHAALRQLEDYARKNGFAIGTGSGLPAVIDAVESWSQKLGGSNIVIVPVSAVFKTQRS
jgi:polysaccharide deacetylase 2 family uncharacterized protein YibQ